jgi:hypothetical protein
VAAIDEMLTMKPSALHARIARTAAWHPTRRPRMFVSSIARHSSGSPSTIGAG